LVLQYIKVSKFIKLIGSNLEVIFNKDKLILIDFIDGKEINVIHEWKDIKCLQYVDFRTMKEKITQN